MFLCLFYFVLFYAFFPFVLFTSRVFNPYDLRKFHIREYQQILITSPVIGNNVALSFRKTVNNHKAFHKKNMSLCLLNPLLSEYFRKLYVW